MPSPTFASPLSSLPTKQQMYLPSYLPYLPYLSLFSDSTPLTALTILGTHDSFATHKGPLCTQHLQFAQQLQVGTRFLDLRYRKDHKDGMWKGYHDTQVQNITMTQSFSIIGEFLQEHPTEFIIARIRHEDDRVQNNKEIQDAFANDIIDEITRQQINVWGLREPNTTLNLTQKDYGPMPLPLVGLLRGKLLILTEAWTHPRLITQTWLEGIALSDEWQHPPSVKLDMMKRHIQNASQDSSNKLYITFVSTAVPEQGNQTCTEDTLSPPQRNALISNEHISKHIQELSVGKQRKGKLGIIVVDSLTKEFAKTVQSYAQIQHQPIWADWANVPHVSPCTYPEPPSNSKLIYTEIIQRHHQRTPYGSNLLPNENRTLWNAQVPSAEAGYPMLTFKGHNDSVQHGHDLRKVYGDMLGFLPAKLSLKVQLAITTNPLTPQVLSSLMKGLFPEVASYQHEPITDSLEPGYTSPEGEKSKENDRITRKSLWQAHRVAIDAAFAPIDQITGIALDDEDWHKSADHYFDNFSAKVGHGIALPEGISDEKLAEIRKLGDIDYQLLYGNQEYCVLSYSKYLTELLERLGRAGSGKLLYRHNVAHDGSLARLLGVLQDNNMGWPGMGTEVVFEVWKSSGSGKHQIRVLKNGAVLTSTGPWARMENINLTDFIAHHRKLLDTFPETA